MLKNINNIVKQKIYCNKLIIVWISYQIKKVMIKLIK